MGDWLNNPELKITNVSGYNKNHVKHLNEGQLAPLKRIRQSKYVEPKNTGENHPKNAYIMLGHGGEDTISKKIVPKGCVLVVKSHSGDTTDGTDYKMNIMSLLSFNNKEITFDPVGHKKELFRILSSDSQASKNNITASHSSAIYREGDTYNDFSYGLLCIFDRKRHITGEASGLYKLNDTEKYDSEFIFESEFIYKDENIFIQEENTYKYNDDIVKKILKLFEESHGYKYYYTKQFIQDILDIILMYINIYDSEKIKTAFGTKFIDINNRIKKITNSSLLNIFISSSIPNDKINDYFTMNEKSGHALLLNYTRNIVANEFMMFLRRILRIKQSQIFKDVEDGILEPGVFYNIICRATENTLLNNHGILNSKYLENSDHTILVHNKVQEIKNRISEAVLKRKDQARDVFGNRPNTGKIYKRNGNKWIENTANATRQRRRKRKNRKTRRN